MRRFIFAIVEFFIRKHYNGKSAFYFGGKRKKLLRAKSNHTELSIYHNELAMQVQKSLAFM